MLVATPTVREITESPTGLIMFFVYSFIYAIALVVLFPYFLFNREKYLSGLKERLGFIPTFKHNGRPVAWVHCVSVGETNAAIPLVRSILKRYPNYRIVVTTTTKTGQDLAKKVFKEQADLVFYMPFDLPFIVNRVLGKIRPNIVLVVETEIWLNFFRSAHRKGARLAVVNGRLSEKSASRYAWIKGTMKRVLRYVDIALMQTDDDAKRLISLGIRHKKVKVTGNFKFDQRIEKGQENLTAYFRERFGFDENTPLIVAASTHDPEERWILEAFKKLYMSGKANLPRLMLVPRHPERFDEVADLIEETGLSFARRTAPLAIDDELADVVLLDTIGELRSVYPVADIVFVGGSLIPHGGQSIFEPALAKKSIVTGSFMANFQAAVDEFALKNAFVQIPELEDDRISDMLAKKFAEMIDNPALREKLAENAFAVVQSNRGATARTMKHLKPILQVSGNVVSG